MYGYIYLTTNLIDGKKYIGRHKAERFEPEKYIGSGKYLEFAFKKYGKENFSNELLCECMTEQELYDMEYYYINLYNAVEDPMYYNLVEGGLGKNIKGTIYITNGAQYKKLLPEEALPYLEQGWYKGGPIPTLETISKRVAGMKGKKRSLESRKRISESTTGKKKSALAKENMSNSHKGKPSSIRGTILINNGEVQKRIPPEDFPKYESLGFKRGLLPSKGSHKHNQGKIKVFKDNTTKYINEDELDLYIGWGYQKGTHFLNGKVFVNNGVDTISISPDQLEEYLNLGYVRGFINKNN